MGSVAIDMTCADQECGGVSRTSAANNDGIEETRRWLKAWYGSCNSSSNLADGHNSDSKCGQVLHSERVSSVVGSDCKIDIGKGVEEVGTTLKSLCPFCMSSLYSEYAGTIVEIRCSCKSWCLAHLFCADHWFQAREKKICEICKSILQKVVIPNDIGFNRYLKNPISMLRDSYEKDSPAWKAFADDDEKPEPVPVPEIEPEPEPISKCSVWDICKVFLVLLLIVGMIRFFFFIVQKAFT